MEIDINFVCPCGAFLEETISCAHPDLASDERHECWETLICDGCTKDFSVHIVRYLSEVTVSVAGAIDLSWETPPHTEEENLIWEIESTKQLDIYKKVTTDIVILLKMDHPFDTQATLNNMLYAQVVTAIEAYLSGIFIHTVVKSDALIRKLVESDPELAKRQFSLQEIFNQWENLKILVARYLKDLIFHDIKKIKPMYHSVLDIDFGDVGWLFKAVLIRHDCIHRNGFDKDGNQTKIDTETIKELIGNCTRLVSIIEEEIYANHAPLT